ncbi:MAG TPA: hypothetical protein VEU72_02330 [Nitrosopumilaceae archaeon]|nr:hypothetical protein [Nitrosopumilaceae archaeon]
MDFTKISYEILAIDDSMRYVEIIGENGELLLNKMKQGKHSVKAQRKEELLSLDLYNTKQIEKKFNKTLGKVAFTHVCRTKVHQLVWYHNDLIFYCTCEGHVDNNKILEISSKIGTVLGIGKPIELHDFFEIPN